MGIKSIKSLGISYYDDEAKPRWQIENPRIDDRDIEIVKARVRKYDAIEGPRIGDYIRLSMPKTPYKRITHIWRDLGPGIPDSIQTSLLEGSYYLGDGYISYSGGLIPGFPATHLRPTNEAKQGSVWFFHHDIQRGAGGVHFMIPFRIYEFVGPMEIFDPFKS